jgi:hypothetical protein
MTEQSWLEKFHQGESDIESIVKQLERLSYNFEETGNQKVADDLKYMSIDLTLGLDKMSKAIDEDLTNGTKEAWGFVGKTLTKMVDACDKK